MKPPQTFEDLKLRFKVIKCNVPYSSTAGPRVTASVQHTLPTTPEPVSLQETMAPTELMAAEMSFSALYMHQVSLLI